MARAHAAALLLAVLFAGSQVHAQLIDGRVRSAEDGAPLIGAFVRLLDPSGRQIAGVLTDARGAYVLTAPAAGEYRIRIELIGREAVESGPLRLEPGQRSTWSAALSARPIEIRGLTVEGAARCEVRPEEGTLVARAWDEARKALEVASWAQRQELFRYHLVTHRRELDRDGRRIIEERRQGRAGFYRPGFNRWAMPAYLLHEGGWVRAAESPAGDTIWRRTAPAGDEVTRRLWELGDGLERRTGESEGVPPTAPAAQNGRDPDQSSGTAQ